MVLGPFFLLSGGIESCLELRVYRTWVVEGRLSWDSGAVEGASRGLELQNRVAEGLFPGILGGSSGLYGMSTLNLGGMGPFFPGGLGGIVTCLGVCVCRIWVVEGPLYWDAEVTEGARGVRAPEFVGVLGFMDRLL